MSVVSTDYIIKELDKIKSENQELRNLIIGSTKQNNEIPCYQNLQQFQPRNKRPPDLMSPLILSNYSTVDTKDSRHLHVTFSTLATNSSPQKEQEIPIMKQLVPRIFRDNHGHLALSDLKACDVQYQLIASCEPQAQVIGLSDHIQECPDCSHSHKMMLKYKKKIQKHFTCIQKVDSVVPQPSIYATIRSSTKSLNQQTAIAPPKPVSQERLKSKQKNVQKTVAKKQAMAKKCRNKSSNNLMNGQEQPAQFQTIQSQHIQLGGGPSIVSSKNFRLY